MDAAIDASNGALWDPVLIRRPLGAGLHSTVRLGAILFLHFREMLRVIPSARATDKKGISPFQAPMLRPASRASTGNLAGVKVAATLGGPGANFRAWMVALFGRDGREIRD